jgi:hypothetical protein
MPRTEGENFPDETDAMLGGLAATQPQSLEEFVLETLAEVADSPAPDPEFFERHWAEMRRLHGDRPPVTRQMILDALDEGRASR